MQWLMMQAWADSTKRALSTEYKAFKAYCRIANITSLPVSGHQLAIYAVWLLSSGRLKSTAPSLSLPSSSNSSYPPNLQILFLQQNTKS